MSSETLTLEPFTTHHIAGAHALTHALAWPHRPEDWALLSSLSTGHVLTDGQQVLGTALATPFGRVSMLNMIIVDKSLRGRGFGRQIMARAMADHTPQEWRLVATSDGLPLYRKLGFVETTEVLQFQGMVTAVAEDAGAVERAGPDDLDALASLDEEATGMARRPLLQALLRLGEIRVLREGARIEAYAALRSFGRGEVAGPVIARDGQDARRLLGSILRDRAGSFLRVDTTVETGLSDWLGRHGLTHVGGGIAMTLATGTDDPAPDPKAASHHRFALAAQALG